jgi:hypothetical protein
MICRLQALYRLAGISFPAEESADASLLLNTFRNGVDWLGESLV